MRVQRTGAGGVAVPDTPSHHRDTHLSAYISGGCRGRPCLFAVDIEDDDDTVPFSAGLAHVEQPGGGS